MELDKDKEQYKAQQAASKPRDDEGHFAQAPLPEQVHKDPVGAYFAKNVHYKRDQEDLLDVRVGNPLKKIVDLLEEIKKQKAFSFTLKGSLGVAGVFLALSVFGVFGGGKILCDKGLQSEVGTVKALKAYEIENTNTIPVISNFISFFKPKTSHQRIVLVKADSSVIDLPYTQAVDVFQFNGQNAIVTGNYDACARSIDIKEQSSIELFSK